MRFYPDISNTWGFISFWLLCFNFLDYARVFVSYELGAILIDRGTGVNYYYQVRRFVSSKA